MFAKSNYELGQKAMSTHTSNNKIPSESYMPLLKNFALAIGEGKTFQKIVSRGYF